MMGVIDIEQKHAKQVQAILERHVPQGVKVYAFGSRAKFEASKPFADLDLCLRGEDKLASRVLYALKDAFDESMLPYRVDVLDWHGIAESFRNRIEKDFVKVFTGKTPPQGWKKVKLGEVCSIDKFKHNGKPAIYVGMKDVGADGSGVFLGSTSPSRVKSTTFAFDTSHVLYGRLRAYFNKVLLPNFDGHCSSEIFPLKVGSQMCREWLFYWLISEQTRDKINATSTGTRMPRANMNEVMAFKIPLPPLAEQRAIARVLSALDDKIDFLRRQSKTLEDMCTLLLSKLVRGEVRVHKSTVKIFTGKTPPQGWKKVKLEDVAEIYQPKTIGKKEMLSSGRYKVFGANGCIGYYDDFNHKDAEVLVTCRGATCGTVNMSSPYSWITGNAMVVKPKGGDISKQFLYYYLKNTDMGFAITGSAQPQITRTSIAPFEIPLPPLEEQRVIEALGSKIAPLHRQSETLENMRDLLLPKLMRGEVRVRY